MAQTKVEKIAALKARIAADTAKLSELETAEANEALVANLAAGDVVTYPFGRGETRKNYTGKVAAVYDTEKGGKKVKVLVGEGADLDVQVIDIGSILSVGEVAQTDTPVAAEAAAADPLASIS